MKVFVMAGFLLFVGISSAGAQAYIGGSSINSGGGINHESSINTPSTSLNSTVGSVSQPSQNVQATNPGEFVPSTFENYAAAVSLGEEARRMRRLTVAEAARLSQQARTAGEAKSAIVLEKDADGKLIVLEIRPAESKQIQKKQ